MRIKFLNPQQLVIFSLLLSLLTATVKDNTVYLTTPHQIPVILINDIINTLASSQQLINVYSNFSFISSTPVTSAELQSVSISFGDLVLQYNTVTDSFVRWWRFQSCSTLPYHSRSKCRSGLSQ